MKFFEKIKSFFRKEEKEAAEDFEGIEILRRDDDGRVRMYKTNGEKYKLIREL